MGFNVHAGAAIDGRDRKRVERGCRYLVRPPIATERLGVVGENVRYEFQKVWRDGTRCVVLDPYDFLARACAMAPPPRFHRVRFHGVLAPNAALRREVVSSARSSAAPKVAPPRAPLQLSLFGELFDGTTPPEERRDASRGRGFCDMCSPSMSQRVRSVRARCGGETLRLHRMRFAKGWPARGSRRVDRRCVSVCPWGNSRCHSRKRTGESSPEAPPLVDVSRSLFAAVCRRRCVRVPAVQKNSMTSSTFRARPTCGGVMP
ncbi:transposase [Polyangium mundeleinium]|uniref:transposase n=1 Tax=Polyangium mundeleinium TaxID=2995306 RepID=UPI00358DA384